MESNSSVSQNIDVLFTKLEKFLKTETVIGEPITVGETTIVPIISVMFGCGTGSGAGGDGKGADGSGTGLGVGARVLPNAVVVIKKDDVKILPITGKNNVVNFAEIVPEIISKINFKKQKKDTSDV